jgi:hypothetical protein
MNRRAEFINPEQLNQCFLNWVNTLVNKMGGEVIPIDGKTLRGQSILDFGF